MRYFEPLIAARGDWWSFIVPIVFFIIYVLNQLLAVKGKVKPAAPRRPGERAWRPPQPEGPTGEARTQLDKEIEQFLKRAGQDRSKPKGEAPKKSKAPPKPPRPANRPPVRDRASDSSDSSDKPRELSTVSQSVEQHMANRGFKERAEHLTDDITRADQQMEQHLQQAFTRKVGTLTEESGKTSATPATDTAPSVESGPATVASTIAALLTNPQNVRSAIVLNEILNRPEHRW